jgi:hypothetical protein
MLRVFASFALVALLTACAGSHSSAGIPSSDSSAGRSRVAGTCCTLWWSKKRLTLRDGVMARAVLTFWSRNGYFFYPADCEHGSQISVATGRTWGDPSTYEHVVVKFKTQGPGPDRCAITAVLNNTGSPPLATLKLRID